MRDFTLNIYKTLLEKLLNSGFNFVRFDEWAEREGQSAKRQELEVKGQKSIVKSETEDERRETEEASGTQGPFDSAQGDKTLSAMPYALCVLRHDVDRLPGNSLATARMENELGIKGTYYFRIVPASFDEKIIKEIATLGHEVGYHYEEIDFAWRQINGQWSMFNGQYKKNKNTAIKQSDNDAILDLAYSLFKINLEKLRNLVPVTTICMHGSPLSKYDNKLIWGKYGYRALGIIGEPYFDIDWNEFGYLTDTGRSWKNGDISIRDRVESKFKFKFKFKSTQDIIKNVDRLPDKIMINIHPQRWTDSGIAWVHELVWQNMKNVVKRKLVNG